MSTRGRGVVLFLAAAVPWVAGCSKTVPVGAVISESGAVAVYGEKVHKGLDLALEEINAEGGFKGKPLELVYRDDATHPEVGKQVTEELIHDQGIGLIIGAVSSTVTLAIAPICEQEQVVLMSPTASSPELTQAGFYVFRNHPSDVLEGTAMAEFARDLGLETVAVFAVDNPFGAGLKEVFAEKYESKYRKVIRTFDFPEGAREVLDPMVEELVELSPEGIYIIGYLDDVAAVLERLRAAGVDSIVLTPSSVTEELVNLVDEDVADTVIFPQPLCDPNSDEPSVQAFARAYRDKYGEDPDRFAAHGYDALHLLLEGMKTGGSPDPKDVKVALPAIDNYQGACGRISFDQNGDVVQYPQLFIIRNGRAVPYQRFSAEGGALEIPGR